MADDADRTSGPRLRLTPITLAEAKAFVGTHHRHHKFVLGHLFGLGCLVDGRLVGVAIVGRPVARMRDDGETAEVTRLCTDGTRNACSFLYGACAREAAKRGYTRIGTYILESENGASLRASNWTLRYKTRGGSWHRAGRPRIDKAPTVKKFLYERMRK